MTAQIYTHPEPLTLESGQTLHGLQIAYHTYGTLSPERDNVVWVCHALTANSDVADWWPHTVEPGAFLDPERFFVVCANILGSPYGTSGPMTIDPATGDRYFDTFPKYTIRDIVAAHRLLADRLGIGRIHALIGASVGGFQAVEWAVEEPERIERLVLIATDAKASPWTIAIDETQRMAIKADATWGEKSPEAAAKGLAAARAIGLLTYRGPHGYNLTQQDPPDTPLLTPDRRPCTYQRHQGKKLVDRFDAYSYVAILDAFDTHDAGRGRGGVDAALKRITARTIVVGLSDDIIFTPGEMRTLSARIPGSRYVEIDSPFGHDGFLVEHELLNSILKPFLSDEN